jgi:NAD(P)-dependent dehydrogenase (short-subunit alcohol dehydrogenase family)
MTKTAQLAVSRGLAESVAGTGITVNSVLPGPTSLVAYSALAEKAGFKVRGAREGARALRS